MSEFDNLPQMATVMDRDLSGFSSKAGDLLPAAPAQPMMMQTTREITAKKVAVARHIPLILQEIRQMCAAFGDTYVYSWEVNNRQKGTKETIKGPTIKMAMMLVQAFGNCSVDMDITETPTHLVFKSWFMDYEKGTSLSRLFQQRKSQNTGMKDADRQADIIFQIGQSKAARNVVVNALSSFTSYALEESEKGLLAKFQSPEAIDAAWAFMDRVMDQYDIDLSRVEAVVGRRRKDFTIPNLAKAYMMLRGVSEGLTAADDQFPTLEAAAEMQEEQEAEKKETQSRATRTPKKSAKAAEEAPKGDEQPSRETPSDGKANEAPQADAPAAPQFKETMIEKIKAAYFEAEDFGTIQAIRADVAKNAYQDAPGLLKAYDDAMVRVKAANAARAKKAGEVDPVEQEQLAEVEADMKGPTAAEREEMADRIVAMFDGLDDTAEIGEALRKAAHYADHLDEDGDARFKEALQAAQGRAQRREVKEAAAKEAPKPEIKKAAPLGAKAAPTMFSDDD